MALGNIAKGLDIKTLGLALGGGLLAAVILSKVNATGTAMAANATIQAMANEYPGIAIPTYGGVVKSRGFPDQSIKYNSLPSPMVEYLVPYDSSGRYAQVTGAYDRCNAVTFP